MSPLPHCSPGQMNRQQHSRCASFIIPSDRICCFSWLSIRRNYFHYCCCHHLIRGTVSCSSGYYWCPWLHTLCSQTTICRIQEARLSEVFSSQGEDLLPHFPLALTPIIPPLDHCNYSLHLLFLECVSIFFFFFLLSSLSITIFSKAKKWL